MKVTLDFKTVLLLMPVVLIIFIGLASTAVAQETEMESSEATSEQEVITLEGVVVVGTRAKPRSVLESAVPIDVLPSEDFVKQGGTDLPDLLRNLVPSYNVNAQPIADAATVVRPANLRGLAPDHTLLLVNGKRRHRASVIAWLGNGLSDGAQGADLSFFLMSVFFLSCDRIQQAVAPEGMEIPDSAAAVKIGFIYSPSDPGTTRKGAELAIALANAAGGINHNTLAII